MVVIDPHILTSQRLTGVNNDLETVAVHSPARMAGRNLRQLVSSLKAEPSPEMGVIAPVQIDALIAGALHADRLDPRRGQPHSQPARQILVSRNRQMLIEQRVIERRNRFPQALGQRIGFAARK